MTLETIQFNVGYKPSSEEVMDSTVRVKYDGNRHFWLIDVLSHTDSIKKLSELRNRKWMFCWDGKKYVDYFLPGNRVVIAGVPDSVIWLLTAGLIPWRKDVGGLEKLFGSESEGFEKYKGGCPELLINITDKSMTIILTLDPQKQYAVKQYAVVDAKSIMILQNYENYQKAGRRWCPTKITLEKYDLITLPPKLLVQDVWDIDIDEQLPLAEEFDVDYEMDALINNYAFGTESLQYHYWVPDLDGIDIDELM